MGYRSDVRVAFYTQDPSQHGALKLWLESNIKCDMWYITECYADKDMTHPVMLYSVDQVKWYPDYPEVMELHTALAFFVGVFRSGMEEPDPERPIVADYEFLRVGEEAGDIEQEHSNYARYLHVTTNIVSELYN